MGREFLLICSRISPGPIKVIRNLQGTLKGVADIKWKPLEDILIPRLSFSKRTMTYRYLRLHEYLRFMNVDSLLEYGERIFFVGWGTANEVLLEKLNKKGITPSLIMCSTIGQSDFNDLERKNILQIITHVKKGTIKSFLLNKRLYQSFGKFLPDSIYFPYTIDLQQFKNIVPQELNGTNVDIFCSVRPGKNILNQILAFKLSQISGVLHINFNNSYVNQFMSELDIKPVVHSWMEESKYYNLVAAMTLSLQMTFTESFSYAVCERMCLSVPPLTSCDIYLIAEDPFLSKYLCIETLDTPFKMAKHIKKITEDGKLCQELARRCRLRIEQIAGENNNIVKEYIRSYGK